MPAGSNPFPPIADYGFISDCEACALIAPSGNIEWMCLPRMDGPSIFAAILDRGAGCFQFGPQDVSVPTGRRYLPGTMVLETTWDTRTGWAVVHDALLMGPWFHHSRRSLVHQRAPSDYEAENVLVRTVTCLNGAIDFVLECEPAFDYGRRRGVWRHTGEGYGKAEIRADDGDSELRLLTDLYLGFEGPRAVARRRLSAGDQAFCALAWGEGSPPKAFAEADDRMTRTATSGVSGSAGGSFPTIPGERICSDRRSPSRD